MNMLARLPAEIPDHPTFITVKVVRVRHWNEHLFSFGVERPASFRFRSGEFVMLGLPGENGKALPRSSDGGTAQCDRAERSRASCEVAAYLPALRAAGLMQRFHATGTAKHS